MSGVTCVCIGFLGDCRALSGGQEMAGLHHGMLDNLLLEGDRPLGRAVILRQEVLNVAPGAAVRLRVDEFLRLLPLRADVPWLRSLE